MRQRVRPDVIRTMVDAYEQVRPSLLRHQPGFPAADALRAVIVSGQPSYGMAAVGPGRRSLGADLILRAADKPDPRPLWVLAWGGTNTLAQALTQARADRSRLPIWTAWWPDCASTRFPIRTTRDRGFAESFRRCITSPLPRRRTGSSTTLRRGPASAAIASTRTRPAPTSPRSPMRGSTRTSGPRGRLASTIRCRAAFTKGTRRRSSA